MERLLDAGLVDLGSTKLFLLRTSFCTSFLVLEGTFEVELALTLVSLDLGVFTVLLGLGSGVFGRESVDLDLVSGVLGLS